MADPTFLFLLFLFLFFFFTVIQPHLYIFPVRMRLMLPAAAAAAAKKKDFSPHKVKCSTINKLYSFCKQSAPGAPLCVSAWGWKIACLRQKGRFPSSISCGNHSILPNITNLRTSPILLYLTSSNTRGANPTMVINLLDGCQLCFLFRWNMPPPLKSVTPPPSQLLSSDLWTEPGAWDYGNIWPPTFDPPRRPCMPLNRLSPAITQSDDSLKGDPR